MTETVKASVAGAVVASGILVAFGIYQQVQEARRVELQKVQQQVQRQTEAEKSNMLDFTQSLETLAYDLNKEDLVAFDTNADKFKERMERSEFAEFLDYREADTKDDSFRNEVSIVLREIDTFRRERKLLWIPI